MLRTTYYDDPYKGSQRLVLDDFDVSMTDQSYDFSTEKLVENFFSTGRNLLSIKSSNYQFPDGKDDNSKMTIFDTPYNPELPDVSQAVQRTAPRRRPVVKKEEDVELTKKDDDEPTKAPSLEAVPPSA